MIKPALQVELGMERAREKPLISKRNADIQYLRGYAALFVVIDHSILRLAHSDVRFAGWESFAGDLGAMGVTIFFAISGYIMLSISGDKFGCRGAVAGFWKARVKRIAPLYYIATIATLCVPVFLSGRSFSTEDVLKSLVFIATDARPDEGALRPVLGVGWTLNYEMFFYLVFGLSLLLPKRVGLVVTFFVLGALIVLGKVLPHFIDLPTRSPLFFYTYHLMALFAAGMVLAIWRSSAQFQLISIYAPAALGMAFTITILTILNLIVPGQYPLWRTVLFYGVAIVPVLLCVVAKPRRPHKWLELIGDASFSIYLFHGFALTLVIAVWGALFGTAYPFIRVGLCVAFGLAAGIITYLFVETPIVRALKPGSRQATTAM